MKYKIILLLIALLPVSGIAFAQKAAAKENIDIDKELEKCLKKPENMNTAAMCDCHYAALEKWDKKLNTTYKALLTKLDSTAKGKLVEAQRQWIKFKEKEIELVDGTIGQLDGTMWQPVRADRVLSITKARAIELADLLTTLSVDY